MALIFQRDAVSLSHMVSFLKRNKKTFSVKHGTYTTILETSSGKFKYETARFHDRVFIAAKLIRRDVLNSDRGRTVIEKKHNKRNFGHNQDIKPFSADRVLNIDISSAYATCLHVNGLITDKTHQYLKSLRKEERLPAIGMLARSQCIWRYDAGECVAVDVNREETAEVFFFLIAEIDYVMQSAMWELGKHYYFHWVDGIFFAYDTPPKLVQRVEHILQSCNYHYKYEYVENFKLTVNKRGIYTIDMEKNGEQKRYQFSRDHAENQKILSREIIRGISDVSIQDSIHENAADK